MRKRVDWSKIDPILPDLVQQGLTQGEIAQRLSISTNSVCRRLVKLQLWEKFDAARGLRLGRGKSMGGRYRFSPVRESLIQRRCLHCHQSFMAETRFIRLCPYCRSQIISWSGSVQ